MIIFKTIFYLVAVLAVVFLWFSSINLTKPYYNHTYHIWEEDTSARTLSNIAIFIMLVIAFTVGYLIN